VLNSSGELVGVHSGKDTTNQWARHVKLRQIQQFIADVKRPQPKALPKAAPDTYAALYARVQAGERVTWTGTPPGMAYGTYDCYLSGGRPVMVNVCADGKCPLKR
jgi:hypothetical protein